ncbi:hypothetical protein P4S64_07910 [Vibrio sp. M60_M31a]
MMGQVIPSMQVPVDKTVGGILALTEDEVFIETKLIKSVFAVVNVFGLVRWV